LGEERVERRSAAILAADVVGYSRLMGEDEESTLAALKTLRRELIDPKVKEHHGRIVKTTGDGASVEFTSVVDTVRCAVEIQRKMIDRNADVLAEWRIAFRIGINLGAIIIDEGGIYGTASTSPLGSKPWRSRAGSASAGSCAIRCATSSTSLFDDMGDQQVKNISRPVRVYRVGPRASGPHAAGTAAVRPDAAPLPDEEVITALSRIRCLFIVARNSSFTYKRQAVDVKDDRRELGVRYVLEGSVRKGGRRVRITGQLIDAVSGTHLWADRFDV
jgi:adenylate cyclase